MYPIGFVTNPLIRSTNTALYNYKWTNVFLSLLIWHVQHPTQATHPIPIITPPSMLKTVPKNVTPPLVPRGTLFPEVIRIGLPFDSIPSSDAKVSARLVEWWAIKAHVRADANGSVLKSVGCRMSTNRHQHNSEMACHPPIYFSSPQWITWTSWMTTPMILHANTWWGPLHAASTAASSIRDFCCILYFVAFVPI